MADVSHSLRYAITTRRHGSNTPQDSEYCLLRTEATVRIPRDADPAEYAPLLCAGVTVFNGIRKMNITPGDIVAIQGLGGLGHLAVQYARKLGYRTVALSTSASKRDFAMELGATDYIDTSKEDAAAALQKMGGASLIVVTAPNPKVMGPLVGGLGACGKLLILARE
jgi:D-arabinose 1-dehydrogenase-like Zn-dependent alcohol dehydrogenase